MKISLFFLPIFLISACANGNDEDDIQGDDFSTNSATEQLFVKSRDSVSRNSGIKVADLTREYLSKYVETKREICIIWFPRRSRKSESGIDLDDRNSYSTCLNRNESISKDMEFSSFRYDF